MPSEARGYLEKLEIVPLVHAPKAVISVPGSKSITNRALVLAALNSRREACTLVGALRSEDTEVMIEALRALSFRIRTDWDASPPSITVLPNLSGRVIPAESANLFVGNSGTTMRFLTAAVSLGSGRYRIDGVPRMRERPIGDLLAALRQLGVRATSAGENDCPPVVIESAGWQGNQVTVGADVSSQFVSGLLLAAPFSERDINIAVLGKPVSRPYLDMTVRMLQNWDIAVSITDDASYGVPAAKPMYRDFYEVEPDASAASYFFAAAAIAGGTVTVADLTRQSIQGDVRFVDLLEQMGCRIEACSSGITVHGRPLHGIDVDMNDISDTVMTLGAVACFAAGPTTIRNVAHIRHKETDRLVALAAELRRVGVEVDEFADGLRITPRSLHGAEVETYNDHRMAMSLALVGLKVPGIVIHNPGCVAKTYPGFWEDLDKLR